MVKVIHTIDLGGKIRFLNSTTSGINLVLKNLIIKNGNASSDDNGGAVYIKNGNGIFINCTFTGNFAWSGGAVCIYNGNGSFINSTFTGNHARYAGGAVSLSSGSFINSTFTNNTGKCGGAVSLQNGNGSFINSTFTDNNAIDDIASGGAVYIEYRSSGSFINSTFTSNNATFYGGAVSIKDSSSGSFVNCNFTGNNVSASGGAVYIKDGNGSFINSTFTGNNAGDEDGGGAVYIKGNGSFVNCTFTGNNVTKASGGAVYITGGNGSFINSTFTDNIVKNGGGAVSIKDGDGSFINCTFTGNFAWSGSAVLIESGSCSFINCNFTGNNASTGTVAIASANCSFIDSTFTGNTAKNGGAVYIYCGNGSFINSTFTNNTGAIGGAVCIKGNGSFINSTFTDNTATDKRDGQGGAVFIMEGNGSFINSIFTGNNATVVGGAVAIMEGNGSFINSIFTSNKADSYGGGALVYVGDKGSVINSTFTNNTAPNGGALLYRGNDMSFINSTFTNNTADTGGAIFTMMGNGTAILCRFNTENDNITENVTVIPASINVINYTSTYQSGEKLEFNLTADDMVFDGFNTTINIFKDGELVKTVYGLTGEGWIVDLNPGVYTAVLNLTDYPAEKSSNATINISKEDTTVVIDPIVDAILGKEVLINFTTNSNGTATIKVNGVPINSATFTPTQVGTYNVTVDIAENDYYTAGSAETNFTVEKLASSILADSVSTTYTVDKFLVISLKDSNGNPINGADLSVNLRGIKNYTTNENGQVLINVAKIYPKTYNAMITYAGSDNFNGSTGSAKVTVNKITSTIIAKSATFKLNQNIKKYTITLKYLSGKLLANKKVVLNFNGKTYAVKTNNKGQGVFKIYKHLKKGSYNAVITVPENSYYNKVIKKVKITVK